MYTTKKDENNEYQEIVVDDKIFYKFIRKKENEDACDTTQVDKENIAKDEETTQDDIKKVQKDDKNDVSNEINKKEDNKNNEVVINVNTHHEAVECLNNMTEKNDDNTEKHKESAQLCDNILETKENKHEDESQNKKTEPTEPDAKLDTKNVINLLHKINNTQHSSTDNKRKAVQPKRKRYSDQFKDPAYIKKDMYRKIKMLENFMKNNKDINEEIEKYKNYISKSIEVLKNDYQMSVVQLFRIFNLKEYNFEIQDYCNESEE
ncbi:hypothetical protein BDAP_002007 [Binucleata daphniae]